MKFASILLPVLAAAALPAAASAAACKDHPTYQFTIDTGALKSCRWLRTPYNDLAATRQGKYCGLTDVNGILVSDVCQRACGDDATYRFTLNIGATKTCPWLRPRNSATAAVRRERYCDMTQDGLVIGNKCKSACDACDGYPALTTTLFQKKRRPNILIIFADDVGTGDIPFYWNTSKVQMPNLKRLAERGLTFRDAHSTPLCAPSRYMLLSGNYAHRGHTARGIFNIGQDPDGASQFLPRQKSIAEVLRDDGNYHTAMFGKWHLGGKIPPDGLKDYHRILTSDEHDWSLPLVDGPQTIGFDASHITLSSTNRPPYAWFRDGYLETDPSEAVFWSDGTYEMPQGDSTINNPGEGDPGWDSTAYNMILVNETIAFLDGHLRGDRADDPFFAYVALGAVHLPHTPPKQYRDGSPVAGEQPTRHMDMLLEMDKVVGSLVTAIEERGLSDDTVIIFSSDNGGLGFTKSDRYSHLSSGPLRGSKGDIHEGGHRVPLMMRFDGTIPANEDRDRLLGLNDLYATLCDLAGVNIPYGSAIDSVSFADYLHSKDDVAGLRDHLATWAYAFPGGGRDADSMRGEALRFREMKYIRKYRGTKGGGGRFEKRQLFNLTDDLSEERNIWHKDDDHAAALKELLPKLLKELGPCPDDAMGSFWIAPGTRKEAEVSCNFFKTDPSKCEEFFEGELKCNSVCGRHGLLCSTFE